MNEFELFISCHAVPTAGQPQTLTQQLHMTGEKFENAHLDYVLVLQEKLFCPKSVASLPSYMYQ